MVRLSMAGPTQPPWRALSSRRTPDRRGRASAALAQGCHGRCDGGIPSIRNEYRAGFYSSPWRSHRTSPTSGNLSFRIILWLLGVYVKTFWTPFASWCRFRTKDTRDFSSPQSPCGSKPYETTSSPTHRTKSRLRCASPQYRTVEKPT